MLTLHKLACLRWGARARKPRAGQRPSVEWGAAGARAEASLESKTSSTHGKVLASCGGGAAETGEQQSGPGEETLRGRLEALANPGGKVGTLRRRQPEAAAKRGAPGVGDSPACGGPVAGCASEFLENKRSPEGLLGRAISLASAGLGPGDCERGERMP
ncbi:hypothetical protein NDU88_006560 [Pleurodeles waltl]|uniref:Uncharacterized protein n=1 Tax=Pleurodeles waltl TaxID=8319 RepID=A0AAV7NUS7_PLEWA|nr:hypothetical protein NDU88_006560 [Pleurodeles waltl]